ncbi:hypothetical protein DFQ27_007785 [Actinomortierella ambigua]|uniref:Mitochondrial carrier n=1 Tax=Actinomortierella ambigua TaxID=1343610 RepID=A0A9P6TZL5_9FUNG|nr:hypothetical protein DFQ27_007785 [Actinomortierella ambigua]
MSASPPPTAAAMTTIVTTPVPVAETAKPTEIRKETHKRWHGFLAGVASGVTKLAVGHPFDTIKVRMQTSGTGRFQGPLHCLMETLKKEGPRALYKGATPPLIGWMFMDSIMLGSLSNYRLLLQGGDPTVKLSPWQNGLAGIGAGITVSFVAAPVEHIKARLQVQYDAKTKLYSGPIDCAKQLIRNNGVRGLWKGLVATMWFRSWFFMWWSSYEFLRRAAALFAVLVLLLVCLTYTADAQNSKKKVSPKPAKRATPSDSENSGILGGWFESSSKKQAREEAAQEQSRRKANAVQHLAKLKGSGGGGEGAAAAASDGSNEGTSSKGDNNKKSTKRATNSSDNKDSSDKTSSSNSKDASDKKKRISKGKNLEGLLQAAQNTKQEAALKKKGTNNKKTTNDDTAEPNQRDASAPKAETGTKEKEEAPKESKKEPEKGTEKEKGKKEEKKKVADAKNGNHNEHHFIYDIVHEEDHAINEVFDDIVWFEGPHRDDEEEIPIGGIDHYHHHDDDEDDEDDEDEDEHEHEEDDDNGGTGGALATDQQQQQQQQQQVVMSSSSSKADPLQSNLLPSSARDFCLRLKQECESACHDFSKSLTHIPTTCADGSVAELLFWGKCCQIGAEIRNHGSSSGGGAQIANWMRQGRLVTMARDEQRMQRQVKERFGEQAPSQQPPSGVGHVESGGGGPPMDESVEDAFLRKQQEYHKRAQEQLRWEMEHR